MTHESSPQAQESASRELQTLPAACQNLRNSNQRVGELLTVVARHATAEAYDALGVLYAEGNKLNCAVPAFEEALRLDEQDWRARYNGCSPLGRSDILRASCCMLTRFATLGQFFARDYSNLPVR
jgi:hypothetical protein